MGCIRFHFLFFQFKKTEGVPSRTPSVGNHSGANFLIVWRRKKGMLPHPPPPLDYIRKIQIVPVTVSTLTPGVTVHAPVVEFWTYVAAGTVICPGTVAKAPVAAS